MKIPKYQSKGKLPSFTNPAIEEWANDWQWRLTPESRSKVMTKWRYTDKKPKEETSKEYTERRVKEEREKDKVGKALNTVADALHTVGQTALTAGLLGSTVIAPWETLGAIGAGTAGSAITDNISRRFTGKSWAENIKDKLNLQTTTLPEMFNPGMLLGGWLGSRMAPTVASWFHPTKAVATPEVKFNPTEVGEYVSPQVRRIDVTTSEPLAGANNIPVAEEKIVHAARGRNFNPIFESDLPELQRMVDNREYKIVNIPRVGEIKMYYPKGNKQPIREDELLKLLSDRNSSQLIPLPSRKEAAKIVKQIREQYAKIIEKNKREIGIDWSDQNFVMASMPDELKASTVGFDNKTPFLTRYYNNVLKVIGENGIQRRLLESGELRKNNQRQWEGLVNGRYQRVDPTEYIKMRIANEKGLGLSLDPISPGATNYPMNGTKNKNYNYLRRPSSSPGQNGYWTGIQDELGNKSGMIEHYKGKGASVPFFRMPEYELPIMKPNGMSSSNSYGGSGQSLMDMLLRKPGNIQRPTYVSDPTGSGMPFNEYNFGPNVPNPKSMWNTLDFELGAGPLAYVPQETQNNLA